MTIQEMHDWFNVQQDKYNSPYFLEEEVDNYINRAHDVVINRIVFKNQINIDSIQPIKVVDDIESSLQAIELLYPIVIKDLPFNSSTSGVVLYEDIVSSVDAVIGGSNEITHLLSLKTDIPNSGDLVEDSTIRYLRYNSEYEENFFKKPKNNKPFFKIDYQGINLIPETGKAESINISLIRKPKDVSLSGGIDSELPYYLHDKIMEYALSLADIPIKENSLPNSPG